MINSRFCETGRPAFFSASPGRFDFFKCETGTEVVLNASQSLLVI